MLNCSILVSLKAHKGQRKGLKKKKKIGWNEIYSRKKNKSQMKLQQNEIDWKDFKWFVWQGFLVNHFYITKKEKTPNFRVNFFKYTKFEFKSILFQLNENLYWMKEFGKNRILWYSLERKDGWGIICNLFASWYNHGHISYVKNKLLCHFEKERHLDWIENNRKEKWNKMNRKLSTLNWIPFL